MWESAGTILFGIRILAPLRRTADNFNWDSRRITEPVQCLCALELDLQGTNKRKRWHYSFVFHRLRWVTNPGFAGYQTRLCFGGETFGGEFKNYSAKVLEVFLLQPEWSHRGSTCEHFFKYLNLAWRVEGEGGRSFAKKELFLFSNSTVLFFFFVAGQTNIPRRRTVGTPALFSTVTFELPWES